MAKRADTPKKGRLVDLSKGMVDVVHPALLDDAESKLLKNASLEEKGTLKPCLGRVARFASPFDADSPCNGIAAFYPDMGTSRLVMGTENGKLFKDTPHLITRYDTQGEFNAGTMQAAMATSDGKVWPMVVSTGFEDGLFADFHTRDSGWTIDDTVYKTGGKSAKGTGTSQKLIREFGMDASQAYIKLACRFAETDKAHYPVVFLSPTGTEIQAMVADADGSFKYHNGSSLTAFPTAKTYAKDTWYVVEVWVRGGTFWVSIDGVSLTPSGLSIKDTGGNSQSKVSKYQVQNAGSNAATMWLDDLTISLLQPVFTRASSAYKQDGTQVADNQPRFETGHFGQAVIVEEGTTNLLPTGAEDFSTTHGWVEKDGAVVTVTPGQPDPFGGNNAYRIQSTGGSTVVKYMIAVTGRPNPHTDTASCWIKVLSGNAKFGLSRLIVNATNEWQRLSDCIVDFASTSSTIYLGCQQASDSLDILVYLPQIENKSYATSYNSPNTTRVAELLTIPTEGVLDPQEGSVEFRAWIPEGPQSYLFSVRGNPDDNNNRMFVYGVNTGSSNQEIRVAIGTGSSYVYTPTISITRKAWHFFAVKWTSTTLKLTIDSETVEVTRTGVCTFGDAAYIGSSLGFLQANALIDDLRISSRARTDQEIADAYASGQPLPVDDDTTYKLSFDDTLNPEASHAWISPVIDVSNATDKGSGHVSLTATTPGGSSIGIASRSAPASTGPWTDWTSALADGTLQHAADNFVQVRTTLNRSGEDDPCVDQVTVSFDGQASTVLLSSDFTAGGQFHFATLMSKLIIVNKLNEPRRWDGTNALETLGGSPPHGQYVAPHKNYLFIAHTNSNPSRLYFSDILNIDSWPVLNFIDISPNDGDWITGLLPYDDYLIIAKNRSIWLLVGGGPSDFEVRRLHAEVGCVAPRSLVRAGETFGFVSHDGIYISDLAQPLLITERLRKTWEALNRRRLSQAAAIYYNHKLRVDVPNGSAMHNNLRIVFDTIRKALYLEEMTAHASCYTKFVEAGKEILLFGHSHEGQVSEADTGTTDDGQPIEFAWESKHFNFGVPEHIKRWRKLYIDFAPAASNTDVDVQFIVDGGSPSSPITITVPGDTTKKVHTARLLPSQVGVVQGHSLGFRITQSTTNGGVGVHGTTLDYFVKGARPTI